MKKLPALLLSACLAVCLTSCAAPRQGDSVGRIVFDRGHGSMWGSQLYMELTPEEIALVRYFPAGSGEQVTLEHIPLSQDAWRELTAAIENHDLEPKRTGFFARLFGSRKQDGGEYQTLTVQWEKETVTYRWRDPNQAAEFALLMEALLPPQTEDAQ